MTLDAKWQWLSCLVQVFQVDAIFSPFGEEGSELFLKCKLDWDIEKTHTRVQKQYTEENENVEYHHYSMFTSIKNQHQHPTSKQFFILN